MVLYLDLIILKEFIMDSILIITTMTVLKKKTNSIRIIIASLIGVCDTLFDIFITTSISIRFILKIIVSILMIKIIYKTKDVKEFAKEIFVFYIVSFIYAGITISIMFSKSINTFLNQGVFIGKYSDSIIVISVIIGIALITYTFKLISRNIRKDNMICNLEICMDKDNENEKEEKIIELKVLLDTGNLLKEPISNLPVIIVEKKKVEHIIKNTKKERKIYLIPYKTLGSENKVLFGIKPEYIRLKRDNIYTMKEVIIGLYDGNISESNSYSGLVRN